MDQLTRDTLPDTLRDELRATGHALADAARAAILPYFRGTDLATENKRPADFDPVTVADRAGEAAMREILEARRPDDGIFGEEHGVKESRSGLTWVLDPIDGTRGFIAGTPTWGVLIGLQDADGPFFGLIDQPYIGERFEGGFGRAEMVGPRGQSALGVRRDVALAQATLFSTFPEIGNAEERARFDRVKEAAKLTRYGMDCYAYALLAAGQIDLVIEAGLQAYDVSASIAVIEAAGGVVTNWEGGIAHEGGRALAAATPEIHAEALALLNASQ